MSSKKIVKPSQLNMRGLYKFEQWRDLINFENGKFKGLYKVSSMGRVYGVKNNKVLKPCDNGKGYLRVRLCKNGECKQVVVHRLVATEFIPNPDNKPYIDHLDTNSRNNKVENLCWATLRENQNNTITLANRTKSRYVVIPYCILDDGTKLRLGVYKGLSQAEREVKSYSENVTEQHINNVLSKKSYRKTCGKIKATADTPDEILALISIHNLDSRKIYWTYIQDYGEFDLEKYLTDNDIIMVK